jgi:ComF family protein
MNPPYRHFVHSVFTGFNSLLGMVYPSECLGCHGPLPPEQLPICTLCTRRLERVTSEMILRVTDLLHPDDRCFESMNALWYFDKGRAAQRLQHAIKYGNRPAYAYRLGRLIGEAYRLSSDDVDIIVPIPLHRSRLFERGYNQSALLAHGIGDECSIPVEQALLRRVRQTASQVDLSRAQRRNNVLDAFCVEGSVSNKRVLIVDDVITTGATTISAARSIKASGATEVHILALALSRS